MRVIDRVSAARFIGRERELAELEASLADARAGQPRLVFIAGESGVGKSRLLAEFERRAQEAGARTIGGECIELGEDELPYAPLVGALRPLAREGDPAFDELSPQARAELARLAPDLGSQAIERLEDREGEAQRRLFDALLALLERLGADEPVVFWLEDIHWADRSTRSFLAFLHSSVRDERVVVVSTYRSDELHRRHPLRPLLTELERGVCSRRLDLGPFDRDELAAQLADILGSAPADEVVSRLHSRSEGNPLFTEELLAAGLDGRGSLPPTLRDALLSRLERLGPDAQQVLGMLAVAGRADDATLARASALEPTELRAALREALATQVLRTDESERFVFRHALIREVLYDDLLPGERSELHLAFARTLAELAESDPSPWLATAVAHHYNVAGAQPEALQASIVAADAAERVFAHGEAADLLDRALGLWPRVADAERLVGCSQADLLTRAARAHYLNADDSRCASLLSEAIDQLDAESEPLRVAELLGQLADAEWGLGQADRSRATLDRALELVPDEPTEEGALLLSHQVRFKLLQGRFGDMEAVADQAIAMAEALGLEEVKAGVLSRLGPALFALGEPERGEEMAREAVELCRRGGNNDELAAAYVNYADVLHIFGRSVEAARIIEAAIPEIAPGNRSAIWVALLRSEIAFDVGDWETAVTHMPHERAIARGSTRVNANLRRADLALGRGELGDARRLLEETWDMLASSVEPQYVAAASVMLAELELRERRTDAARAVVDEALDRIQYCTEDAARLARIAAAGVAVEATAVEHARDLGDGEAERDALARAELMLARTEAGVEEVPGPIEHARLATARAAEAAARRDPEAAALWVEAVEKWREVGRPYPEAWAHLGRAEALLATDERDEAAEAVRDALAIARRVGIGWLVEELQSLAARARLDLGEPLPVATNGRETQEPENPFGLTDRERQVLALVAGGATNREIAAELFMAEKTASVHVSRILGKLSVRSRTEAAAVAHRQGLAGPTPLEREPTP